MAIDRPPCSLGSSRDGRAVNPLKTIEGMFRQDKRSDEMMFVLQADISFKPCWNRGRNFLGAPLFRIMENFFAKIFGSKNSRELKRLSRIVETINSHEKSFEKISDLSDETRRLQKQIEEDRPLSEVLPEAFALVRKLLKGP